jgi:hypothetical protein
LFLARAAIARATSKATTTGGGNHNNIPEDKPE